MAYKALYRKYRPSTFDEVAGQKSVVTTLLNAVNSNKLAHAYLFCGPRGTGKTTVAKLLAKTINCTSEGERPCGKCPNCLEIQESTYPDVIELDAASNNGVDEVREIIEKVKYAPLNGKYKVYIIDEVHMMTSSAFNALLKTLEEPPEYCIFILATTEPHKVLPTIISRCQRFDFKKIDHRVIEGRLREVCEKEEVRCSEEAVSLIAELADGGMRDSLSILDQCIAYAGNDITAEKVGEVYGVASLSEKLGVLDLVKKKDAAGLVDRINDISSRGLDIQRLTMDLLNIVKDAVVYGYSRDEKALGVLSAEQAKKLTVQFTTEQLLRFIENLVEAQGRYRDASNALSYFEVCVLKMMNHDERTAVPQPEEPVSETRTEPKPKPVKEEEEPQQPEYVEYTDERLYEILTQASKAIKEQDRAGIAGALFADLPFEENRLVELVKGADIMASSPDNVILVVDDRLKANTINEKNNKKKIEELFSSCLATGKDFYAITRDHQAFMINYFKAHKNQPARPAETDQPQEEAVQEGDEKLVSLFGKDGFDVVEE
ncbi:MAG: DNA polymerase III subunit gamma/tau [Erysipelotrichaceae bacterium]|nr:DNA polymerase III subunit gamma/tau [Erysipelotrichaceae bacterium]